MAAERSFDPDSNLADLDRLILYNWWLVADGEHAAVDGVSVRRQIDCLLDRRLVMMGLAAPAPVNRLKYVSRAKRRGRE